MKENRLGVVDDIILDLLSRTGRIDDFALAGELRCPRSFLLSKLEDLLQAGYLMHTADGYALTERGRQSRIPLAAFWERAEPDEVREASFDWTGLYVPPADWLD